MCTWGPRFPGSRPVMSYEVCSNLPGNLSVSVELVEEVKRNLKNSLPLPPLSCDSWMFVKENHVEPNIPHAGSKSSKRYPNVWIWYEYQLWICIKQLVVTSFWQNQSSVIVIIHLWFFRVIIIIIIS